MKGRVLRSVGLGLGLILAGSGSASPGQESGALRVRAALIYRIAQMVSWPAETFPTPEVPLRIGLAGKGEVQSYLAQALAGRKVMGHPIEVVRLAESEPSSCHMVIFDGALEEEQEGVLTALRDLPVLTLGSDSHFLALGGMVNLYHGFGYLRVELSLAALARGGLKAGDRLLEVAKVVP